MRIKSKLSGLLFIVILVLSIVFLSKNMIEKFVDAGRCGVGMASCPNGLRCMNGYCKSDMPAHLPPLSDLPIRPKRYPYTN
jgi:Na+/glutamate symporter